MIDTFTTHKWVARDFGSGKQLFINNKKVFTPPPGTSVRRRHKVHVTIPRELNVGLLSQAKIPRN